MTAASNDSLDTLDGEHYNGGNKERGAFFSS